MHAQTGQELVGQQLVVAPRGELAVITSFSIERMLPDKHSSWFGTTRVEVCSC